MPGEGRRCCWGDSDARLDSVGVTVRSTVTPGEGRRYCEGHSDARLGSGGVTVRAWRCLKKSGVTVKGVPTPGEGWRCCEGRSDARLMSVGVTVKGMATRGEQWRTGGFFLGRDTQFRDNHVQPLQWQGHVIRAPAWMRVPDAGFVAVHSSKGHFSDNSAEVRACEPLEGSMMERLLVLGP